MSSTYIYPSYYTSMSGAPSLPPDWSQYLWIAVCGGLAAFFMAWGIGANDVANSFATSVGSGTLKLWQAVIIAAIFEFAGALGLGGETTKTISSDISNVSMFNKAPELYMYGMLCALTIAGVWLLVATYFMLPVSTTHSIIGAVMGFSLVYGGYNGVQWNTQQGNFPFSKGLLPVVLSWFFSPIIGGILSSIIFLINRTFILRSKHSTNRAIWSLPILLFITFFINIMFVLAKGAKSFMEKTWPCTKGGPGMFNLTYTDCTALNNAAAWIAACVAVAIGVIFGGIGIWLLKREQERMIAQDTEANQGDVATMKEAWKDDDAAPGESDAKPGSKMVAEYEPYPYPTLKEDANFFQMCYFYTTYIPIAFVQQCKRGLFYDIHVVTRDEAIVMTLKDNCEVFDVKTERIYQYLQVISACCVAFAHGSNDVANAIGPYSAILTVYGTFAVPTSKSDTQVWVFVLGGLGIVIGLMMYGYRIIQQLGKNLLHLTPTRGFSAELAAGLTISLASFYGIPVSTTQIITGCEVGVGLCEGRGGISWKLLLKIFLGWVFTIILALTACAALFSMGGYAPSIIQSDAIAGFRNEMLGAQRNLIKIMQTDNDKWKLDTPWWNGTVTTMPLNGSRLSASLASYSTAVSRLQTSAKAVPYEQVMFYAAKLTALFQEYQVGAYGQINTTALKLAQVLYRPVP